MKSSKVVLLCVLSVILSASVQAASLSYSATAPGVSAGDIYFLGESANDETNVGGDNNPASPSNQNDAATYIAHDKPGMGQSFTTGSSPILMTGMWLKQVKYDVPRGDGTWWYADYDGGSQLQWRVSEVAGTALNVLSTSNYTVTGTEPGIGLIPEDWSSPKTGLGVWVYFGLDTPVALAANTTYAFDVTVTLGSWGYFFETAGVIDDQYAGGSAYQTTGGANGTNSLNMDTVWDGDHTFVVVPEPATMLLLGLGGLILGRRR